MDRNEVSAVFAAQAGLMAEVKAQRARAESAEAEVARLREALGQLAFDAHGAAVALQDAALLRAVECANAALRAALAGKGGAA